MKPNGRSGLLYHLRLCVKVQNLPFTILVILSIVSLVSRMILLLR